MPLHIETGHGLGKPLQKRLCLFCNREIVEDEFHFMCEYQNLRALRENLCKSKNEYHPGLDDMELTHKFLSMC